MEKLERSDLLTLLWKVIDEQHRYLDAHQSRVNFYSSFISALIAATIAGALNAKEFAHFLFLLTGPLLVLVVAPISVAGISRFHQLFLEAVTMRAKLEQALGMTSPIVGLPDASYWSTESLIPNRHLKPRLSEPDSATFVRNAMNEGLGLATKKFFRWIRIVAAVLLIALCAMAIAKWRAA